MEIFKQCVAPDFLDGAIVIKWAWSGDEPFGFIKYSESKKREEIYGLAICRFQKSKGIYRFSCNRDWEVEQDAKYESIEDAIERLPEQYKNRIINWMSK